MYRFISQPAVLVGLCLAICLTGVVSVQADSLPAVTSGNVAYWYDANTIASQTGAPANGATFNQWNSALGDGNDLYGNTYGGGVYSSLVSSPDPTYHGPGGPNFNGNAYVDFSAGSTMFTYAVTNPKLLGDLTTTVFAVATVPTAAGGGSLYGWGNNSSGSDQAIGLFNGLRGAGTYSAEFSSAPAIFGSAANGVQITELTKSAGAINATTSLSVNGVAQSIGAGSSSDTPNLLSNFFYLGAWSNNLYPGEAQISQVVVYDGVLSTADANAVGYSLAKQYGISAYGYTVPEPSTLVLLVTGLLGLLCYAWRKRR